LKKDKTASYADLKAKADDKKLKVFPIMYGRAKALLGLVPMAKRGEGKMAQAKAAGDAVRRGRPPGPAGGSKSAQIRELLDSGMSPDEIAKKVGATRGLVYAVRSKGGQAPRRRPRHVQITDSDSRPGRGLPRPSAAVRKTTAVGGLSALGDIVAAVQNSERERTQMRATLEKIQALLADALD
jgi:hypothetical protein